MKKFVVLMVLLLGIGGSLLAAGCGGQSQKKVALIFSHEPARWTTGAQMMQEQLQQDGVQVTLSVFSTDEEQTQALQQAVDADVNCIVLAGGDIRNLQAGLEAAKAKNIPVIDYDGLTPDTDAIAYYVTFDNYGVGEAMGKYIEQTKGLKKGQGPYTIEFFSGSETDSNARLMYQGAYNVLKPYIERGQLVIPSGQQAYEQTAIKNWDGKAAQARMEQLVQSQYSGRNLDIVVAASDGIAYGAIDGLAGYSGSWPLITGQDADSKALDNVRSGRMGFTIKKDAQILNQKCIRMIKAVLEGEYLYQFHYPLLVDGRKACQVLYNLNLASAKAIEVFHASDCAKNGGRIGIVLNLTPAYPRSDDPADVAAAAFAEEYKNNSFLYPAVKGCFPEKLVETLRADGVLWESTPEEMACIQANTVDFLGVNYYQPFRAMARETPLDLSKSWLPEKHFEQYHMPGARMNPYRGWEIYPQAIYDIACNVRDNLGNIPWYISENGMGVEGEEKYRNAEGFIEDDYRIDFFKEHLAWLHKGIEEGSNCFGFHAWTPIDCWSWMNAYKNRYGYIALDLATQQKTIKKSGYWMRDVIANNGF